MRPFTTYYSVPAFKTALSIFSILIGARCAEAQQYSSLDTDIDLRGQGHAGLCYAFAEEQLLKDFVCKSDCEHNASQWRFSIFDIVKNHQRKSLKETRGRLNQIDLPAQMLVSGDTEVLPFDHRLSSLRLSACTLEKPVFFLNRSQQSNPAHLPMPAFLSLLYFKLRNGGQFNMRSTPELNQGMQQLIRLAHAAKDSDDFLRQVIDFRSCSDRVALPSYKLHSLSLSESTEIKKLIYELLARNASIYVGVCADVIRSEADLGIPCGRHALVLKRLRQGNCGALYCNDEIEVVDSAFFAKRERNADGSYWLPARVVIEAIAKSGLDFERIRARTLENARNSPFSLRLGSSIEKHLSLFLAKTGEIDFKSKAMLGVNLVLANPYADESFKSLRSQILFEIGKLNLRDKADLHQIPEAVNRAFYSTVEAHLHTLSGNGIVWLEKLGQK